MSFERAVNLVLAEEGGFVNHPQDPGGATNLGITQRTLDRVRDEHPEMNLPRWVQQLTKQHAKDIYRRAYWDPPRCGLMPMPVALVVFDMTIQHGLPNAVRMLQRALGVTDDGVLGPLTRRALDDAILDSLLTELAAQRMVFYGSLSTFRTFGLGWARRMQRVNREAIRWLTHQ